MFQPRECFSTHNALADHNGGHLGDEVDGELVIDLLLQTGHAEPRVPGVTLIPLLPCVGGLNQNLSNIQSVIISGCLRALCLYIHKSNTVCQDHLYFVFYLVQNRMSDRQRPDGCKPRDLGQPTQSLTC